MINFKNNSMARMLRMQNLQPATQNIDTQGGVAPGTPVVIDTPEGGANGITGATGTDNDKKTPTEVYNEALEKAKENAMKLLKEKYANVTNLSDCKSIIVPFEANGKTYTLEIKPTYYKNYDGTYSLYDKTEKGMQSCNKDGINGYYSGVKAEFNITDLEGKCWAGYDSYYNNVNIENAGDDPSNWITSFGRQVYQEDDDGNFVGIGKQKFLYKADYIETHLPEDMLNRFFVKDEDFDGGYKLADNIKSIKLISNDSNGDARYEVVYINDDGEEIGQQFTVSKDNQGNLFAHNKKRVNKTEEKAEAERKAQEDTNKGALSAERANSLFKKLGGLASLKTYIK